MTNSEVLKLIQKNIDGELTPEEKKQLQDYLADDKFASNSAEDISATVKILERVPLLDPPQNLVKKIMAAIDTKRYQPEYSEKPGVMDALVEFFTPRKQWVFAFATGFIIATIMFTLFIRKESPAEYDVMGSIGIEQNVALEYKHHTVINSADVSALLEVYQGPGVLQVNIDCKTDKKCQIDLRLSTGIFHLSNYQAAKNSPLQLKTQSDGLVLLSETSNQYSFTFTGDFNSGFLEALLIVENNSPVSEKIILN